jgi:tRNA(Ile)-lysidine synthase
VRVRQSLGAKEAGALLDRAQHLGGVRDGLERAAARLLAETGQVHEAGYVSLALAPLSEAAPEVQAATLRQMILAVSGGDYAPDLDDLLSSLGTPRTLGGCFVQTLQGRLTVFREAAAIDAPAPVAPGWTGHWDNRFGLAVAGDLAPATGWALGPLGERGLRQAVDRFGIRLRRHPIPLPARLALPALWHGEHLAAQPHLNLGQGLAARAAPRHTVTTCGFTVAAGRPHTIYSSVPC